MDNLNFYCKIENESIHIYKKKDNLKFLEIENIIHFGFIKNSNKNIFWKNFYEFDKKANEFYYETYFIDLDKFIYFKIDGQYFGNIIMKLENNIISYFNNYEKKKWIQIIDYTNDSYIINLIDNSKIYPIKFDVGHIIY